MAIIEDVLNVAQGSGGGGGAANVTLTLDVDVAPTPGSRVFVCFQVDSGGGSAGDVLSITDNGPDLDWTIISSETDTFGGHRGCVAWADLPAADSLPVGTTLTALTDIGICWSYLGVMSSFFADYGFEADTSASVTNVHAFQTDPERSSWDTATIATSAAALIVTGISARTATLNTPDAGTDEAVEATGAAGLAAICYRIESAAGSYVLGGDFDTPCFGQGTITQAFIEGPPPPPSVVVNRVAGEVEFADASREATFANASRSAGFANASRSLDYV